MTKKNRSAANRRYYNRRFGNKKQQKCREFLSRFPEWKKVPLSSREISIIEDFYVYRFTLEDISKTQGVTRQAINQAKRRALKKIEEFYF